MADCYPAQTSFVGSHWPQQNQSCARPSVHRDFTPTYAIPRPRNTGRVSKPRSAGNSPASAGRRRTATMPHTSPMYQPLSSQDYQASMSAAILASTFQGTRRSRPISWHPISMEPAEYFTPQYYPPSTTSDNFTLMPPCSQSLHATPAASSDGNMLHTFTSAELPLSHHSFSFNNLQHQLPMQQSSYLQVGGPQVDAASWDDPPSGLPALSQPVSENWPFDMMAMNQSMPSVGVAGSSYESVSSPGRFTEPATPDFLPIQQFGDNSGSQLALDKENADDELVGMGLYSHPDSFMESSLNGLTGKGLKLEETFTPSQDDEEDDNNAESDDQPETKSSQADSDSPYHTQRQPVKPAGSMMQRSFFFADADDLEHHAVPEARPPLNLGTTTCMNYGYGWI